MESGETIPVSHKLHNLKDIPRMEDYVSQYFKRLPGESRREEARQKVFTFLPEGGEYYDNMPLFIKPETNVTDAISEGTHILIVNEQELQPEAGDKDKVYHEDNMILAILYQGDIYITRATDDAYLALKRRGYIEDPTITVPGAHSGEPHYVLAAQMNRYLPGYVGDMEEGIAPRYEVSDESEFIGKLRMAQLTEKDNQKKVIFDISGLAPQPDDESTALNN